MVEDFDEDAVEAEGDEEEEQEEEGVEAPVLVDEQGSEESDSKFETLIGRLPNCASRERMDEWAVEFAQRALPNMPKLESL